jgi:hypothetical protein
MKHIHKPCRGEPYRAQTIIDIVDAVNALLDSRVGPGLSQNDLGGKRLVSLATAPRHRGSLGGTALILNCTQGTRDTDEYNYTDGRQPVNMHVVTEVCYDTTTQTLYARTRELHFDREGKLLNVYSESDPITIDVAIACTGVP